MIKLEKANLWVTILVGISTFFGIWYGFSKSCNSFSEQNVVVTGFVYKNEKNIPFKNVVVVLKELHTEVPPKFVDDNGFYSSAPFSRRGISLRDNKFDLKIQIKLRDSVLREETKTVVFDGKDNEFSFGDIIIPYGTSPNHPILKKQEPNKASSQSTKILKANVVKGPIYMVN